MTTPVTLPYVGVTTSDANLVAKKYADDLNTSLAVTTGFVSTQVTNYLASNPQVLQSYVDAQNALVAKKADWQPAPLANYIPVTKVGVANGLATLNTSGIVPSTQLPTTGLLTDRVIKCYSLNIPSTLTNILGGALTPAAGTAIGTLLFTAPTTVTSTNNTGTGATQLGTLTIPDPGYPWRAMTYGWIQGGSTAGSQPSTRMQGTGNFGKVLALGTTGTIYGMAACGASYYIDSYPILPYGVSSTPPAVLTGSLQIDIWGSCLSGTSYTFLPTNFVFYVNVVPAI
jgi:hypothetical protein